MPKPLHILIVEDSEDDAFLLLRELRKGGYEVTSERVETAEAMKAALGKGGWDIVISDYVLPVFGGLAALSILKESGQDLPFIIVSGNIGEDIAVGAMKAGAHDYIIKGNLTRLAPAVERELREAEVRREKRQAEEALRRSHEELERKVEERTAELVRSNKELEQFAYIASHDLQEPLRMITSYLDLLDKRYRGKLEKDAGEFIDYAAGGAAHMKTLLNDLLVYSRVGTKGKPFELTDLNISLKSAISNLKKRVEESGAQITCGNLPGIYADETQMVQLFQNLIGNAIKFRNSDAPRVTVSSELKGNEWTIRVSDNGIGIDPKFFDKIFQIFQRLHTKGQYPGTGIGLSICKKIVERHGGRIWVESEPGKGSTFCFTLRVK
ncbi:MAG: hybrid sensor histidine kinase/response regulator [Nitrospiraceae bacterium]|nr:MAG: hybrid sensor histidine kinase/response regulator [Nitrospiraceae bacterium]